MYTFGDGIEEFAMGIYTWALGSLRRKHRPRRRHRPNRLSFLTYPRVCSRWVATVPSSSANRRFPCQRDRMPTVFVVHRLSGAPQSFRATLLVIEDEERRTILLIGEYGSADDPPVGVEIVNTYTDEHAKGARVRHGDSFEAHPSNVVAERYHTCYGGADESLPIPITSSRRLQMRRVWRSSRRGYVLGRRKCQR